MSDKLDEDIRLWASQVMHSVLEATGYSPLNAVERICRDPGIAHFKQEHKCLWWPWGWRVARIHKAAHQLTVMERVCLIMNAGVILDDDGKQLTVKEFCRICKGRESKFPAYVNRAKGKLKKILDKP